MRVNEPGFCCGENNPTYARNIKLFGYKTRLEWCLNEIDKDEYIDCWLNKNYSVKEMCEHFPGLNSHKIIELNKIWDCIKDSKKKQLVNERTLEAKYGDKHYNNMEKNKQTKLERHGDSNYNNREQAAKTNIERYGTPVPAQSEIVKENIKLTNNKLYGTDWFVQSDRFKEIAWSKYEFDGIKFDSSWELIFYIYHKDHGHNIKREPYKIDYFIGTEKHYYLPDFLVDNNLYEIKGDMMLNEDGDLIDFWGTNGIEKTQAKNKLMKSLNVNLITSKEIYPMIKYVEKTYGKDYIKSFKLEKGGS